MLQEAAEAAKRARQRGAIGGVRVGDPHRAAGRRLGRFDGRARGCVALRDLGAGLAEMKRLCVAPEARGHGLGIRLAEAIVARARAAGYRAMRLDTIPGEHDRAIALYRRMGFCEIAAYDETPIPDTLFMELDLQA